MSPINSIATSCSSPVIIRVCPIKGKTRLRSMPVRIAHIMAIFNIHKSNTVSSFAIAMRSLASWRQPVAPA